MFELPEQVLFSQSVDIPQGIAAVMPISPNGVQYGRQQTLEEPQPILGSKFLEIEVRHPNTHGVGKSRFTDYEVKLRTSIPVFKLKESSVRRRYSDFLWLREALEHDSRIILPALPGKALERQLPFRSDGGIFDEDFIEERREGLEMFINKVAAHPLAQHQRSLHAFLQDPELNRYSARVTTPF